MFDRIDPRRFSSRADDAQPLDRKDDAPPAARDWGTDTTASVEYARNTVRGPSRGKAAPEVGVNDRILYAGMTASAAIEVGALRQSGADVTAIPHAAVQDHVLAGGRTFDLGKIAAAGEFARAIGLTGAQADRVAAILADAKPGSRDELAEIARSWAPAERGGNVASRIVLSGHSAGETVYGAGGNALAFAELRRLALAMPRAAAHVEDIHLSGCNTALHASSDTERKRWLDAFPRLQTIWGYQNTCPDAPADHLKIWERDTRGRASAIPLDVALRRANVTVADRAGHVDGWLVEKKRSDLEADLAVADRQFPDFFAGRGSSSASGTPIHDAYDSYKKAVARNDTPASDKAIYEVKAHQLLRLRYWSDMTPRFARAYGARLDQGLAATGMHQADVSSMSRREALEVIAEFDRRAAGSKNPAVEDARMLLHGLRDLDDTIVADDWCQP